MKILILGGTGAMGKPLVDILIQRGHEVYITTRQKRVRKEGYNYIVGDAHNFEFLENLIKTYYDAIVDFMIYSTEEFKSKVDLLAKNTGQYVFISSARVYADCENIINEESRRLLDVSQDKVFLNTDEYSLSKARCEDILRNSKHINYTIIRPYITYSDQRLQLGAFEKEQWLPRVLIGKKLPFPAQIAEKYTTLTYANDVATEIANLIGNKNSLCEAFQLTCRQSVKWIDVINIYSDVIKSYTGKEMEIVYVDDIDFFEQSTYQLKYDRRYDRTFSIEKIRGVTGSCFDFMPIEIGLKKCLENFLNEYEYTKISKNYKIEGKWDKITKDKNSLSEISSFSEKIKYLIYRYVNNDIITLLKKIIK